MTKTLTTLESPFTGGRVFEVETTEEQEFRKEKFLVHTRYYVCEETGEEFTGNGQDALWTNELYGQWRVKHGVPFPEEIKATRLRYGMNYVQITKILGFGANQWKSYEDGCVPSESNGKMMRAVEQKQTMLMMLEASRSEFDENEFSKLQMQVKAAEEKHVDDEVTALFYGTTANLSLMNGYGARDPEHVMAMVRWLVKRQGGITPTKLNKLMFYSDFHHYRRTGRSISGLQYRAIQYGPVPEHYDTIYDNVKGLEKRIEIHHERECTELYVPNDNGNDDNNHLAESEIKTLTEISERYGKLTTTEIIALSHEEEGWKKYQESKSFIPYDEAFSLKG